MPATVIALTLLAALTVWEGLQPRQSSAAHWSVALVIAATVVAAMVTGRGRQRMRSGAWVSGAARAVVDWRRTPRWSFGVAVWTLLVLGVIGWDLNSFVHQAHDLPTLSYLFGRVTRWSWGRTLVFALWLAGGVGLVTGCLARRRTGRIR